MPAPNLEDIGHKGHAATTTGSSLRLGLQLTNIRRAGFYTRRDVTLGHIL